MRLIQQLAVQLVVAVGFGLVAGGAAASPANPESGVDYMALPKALETESGKKVEVTEFFWYACPHCYSFEKPLADWVKAQGDKIAFKRVPVSFDPTFVPQQKLFYSLEMMGKLDELHQKIFQAIHVNHQPLDTDAGVIDFVAKQGVDQKKFTEMYSSFGVDQKVARAQLLQKNYNVRGVPVVAIDGRYMTSPSIAGASLGRGQPETKLHAAALQVMTWLVDQAGKSKRPAGKGAAVAPPDVAKKGNS